MKNKTFIQKFTRGFALKFILLVTVLIGLLAVVLATRVEAQDFMHIAPKQPEKTETGRVVNENAKPLVGHADNEVLVGSLRGVFILSDPKRVRAKGALRIAEPADFVPSGATSAQTSPMWPSLRLYPASDMNSPAPLGSRKR